MPTYYKDILIALTMVMLIASCVYIVMTIAIDIYMSIKHKNFWDSFSTKSKRSLIATPKVFFRVENFLRYKAYKGLEDDRAKMILSIYGPFHVFFLNKIFPLLFIILSIGVIFIPGILSVLGVISTQ